MIIDLHYLSRNSIAFVSPTRHQRRTLKFTINGGSREQPLISNCVLGFKVSVRCTQQTRAYPHRGKARHSPPSSYTQAPSFGASLFHILQRPISCASSKNRRIGCNVDLLPGRSRTTAICLTLQSSGAGPYDQGSCRGAEEKCTT